jgi:hypothetical protein
VKLHHSIVNKLFVFLLRRVAARKPDVVIGGEMRPYLKRWFVLPRNRLFNVYLHLFVRSDDDRALHDHPWLFNASLLLRGTYIEHTIKAGGIRRRQFLGQGECKVRFGAAPHRIQLLPIVGASEVLALHPYADPSTGRAGVHVTDDRPCRSCWTLFITGPVVRRWGFHCERAGWVHWEDFTADGGATIGKGCDQ